MWRRSSRLRVGSGHRGVLKTRPHECPATWHGVPRACHCDSGALREEEDGKGVASGGRCGQVADEDDVVSAIHDGPKSQAEDAAARRRVALVGNRLNYASGSVL